MSVWLTSCMQRARTFPRMESLVVLDFCCWVITTVVIIKLQNGRKIYVRCEQLARRRYRTCLSFLVVSIVWTPGCRGLSFTGLTPQGFTSQTYPKGQLEEAGLAQKLWASVGVGVQDWGRAVSVRRTVARVVGTCAGRPAAVTASFFWGQVSKYLS